MHDHLDLLRRTEQRLRAAAAAAPSRRGLTAAADRAREQRERFERLLARTRVSG